MLQSQVTANGVMTTPPIEIIPSQWFAGVGILVTIPNGVIATYTVQISGDSPHVNPTNWNNHDVLTNQSSSANSNLAYPATWLRLNVTAYSGADKIVMNVVQVTSSQTN